MAELYGGYVIMLCLYFTIKKNVLGKVVFKNNKREISKSFALPRDM